MGLRGTNASQDSQNPTSHTGGPSSDRRHPQENSDLYAVSGLPGEDYFVCKSRFLLATGVEFAYRSEKPLRLMCDATHKIGAQEPYVEHLPGLFYVPWFGLLLYNRGPPSAAPTCERFIFG